MLHHTAAPNVISTAAISAWLTASYECIIKSVAVHRYISFKVATCNASFSQMTQRFNCVFFRLLLQGRVDAVYFNILDTVIV